jgi:hypothetical protein
MLLSQRGVLPYRGRDAQYQGIQLLRTLNELPRRFDSQIQSTNEKGIEAYKVVQQTYSERAALKSQTNISSKLRGGFNHKALERQLLHYRRVQGTWSLKQAQP